ncbi:MAG TPA: DUF6567 family protein [Verrucomicrobiae bacterium]|nr:DUF6567 family protein [Verrucomicrobiae bacterium]
MPLFTEDKVKALREMRRLPGSATGKANFFRGKLLAILTLAGIVALAGGCAAVAPVSSAVGAVTPSSTLQIFNTTEVRLQQKNFVVVKSNVMGQSKGFSLFGLVTFVPAKFDKAMKRLNAQADLNPGTPRTLANLVMEKDSSYWILFSIPRTSVRADVVEFTDNPHGQPPSGIARTDGNKQGRIRAQPRSAAR